MALAYPLIQFGSVYATSDNLSSGVRYISEIEGLEQFALTERIQSTAALDGTIYNQYATLVDGLVVVRFPLIDTSKGDAIRDVVQAAITGNTTYALNITSDLGTFTFTAKPGGVSMKPTTLSGKWKDFEIRQFCTD